MKEHLCPHRVLLPGGSETKHIHYDYRYCLVCSRIVDDLLLICLHLGRSDSSHE